MVQALSALADFVRARQEPGDSGPRTKRERQSDTMAAERVLMHEVKVVGITHAFGAQIDWGFNPTTAPGTSHLFPYAGQVAMRSGWEQGPVGLGNSCQIPASKEPDKPENLLFHHQHAGFDQLPNLNLGAGSIHS
jgi:hypothetical protein